MDIVPILATIILISTLITLIVAIASYMTFRIKEKRKQAAAAQSTEYVAAEYVEGQETSEKEETSTKIPEAVAAVPLSVTPVESATPAANPPAVTPVVIAVQPAQQYTQPAAPVQSVPATQPFSQPAYPQAQQQAQPTTQTDPYGMPFPYMPSPRTPQFSGAQAAFMKGFGPENQPPADEGQQNPESNQYAPPPAMRRFTPPEQKPRQQPPQSYKDDSPAWK